MIGASDDVADVDTTMADLDKDSDGTVTFIEFSTWYVFF